MTLVVFDVLAHLNKQREHILERIGLICFAIAVLAEVCAYPYSRRIDTLSTDAAVKAEGKIAALNKEAGDARQEAARLGKLAADEQLARTKLEAAIQPRTLSVKQQQYMAEACSSFAGHSISVFSFSGDAESSQLAAQVMAALLKAKVRVTNRVGAMILTGVAPAAGVFISNIDPGLANTISKSLGAAGIASTINPPRADEEQMTITVGVKPYGLLR